MKRMVMTFAGVGTVAAIVHLLVVACGVEVLGLRPLRANVAGFLVAFGVSFSGHFHYTFRMANARRAHALTRFFLISGAAFVINQTSYYLGLEWVGARWYLPLLAAVLASVAVLTFLASRYWAFAAHEPEPTA